VDQIIHKYDQFELAVSKAYVDGGTDMLFPRLYPEFGKKVYKALAVRFVPGLYRPVIVIQYIMDACTEYQRMAHKRSGQHGHPLEVIL
jgi:hypothetical protein